MSCCAVDTLGGVPVGQITEPGVALYRLIEDFTWSGVVSNQMNGWIRVNIGGAATSPNVAGGLQDGRHPGVIAISLDLSAPGGGVSSSTLRRSASGLEADDGQLLFDAIYQMVVLPDATDDWTVFIGMGDLNTGLPADGFGFVFDRVASTTDWQFVSRSASVGGVSGTGITAVAGTWIRLRAVINADSTLVEFFMDENLGSGLVLVGSTAFNIPGAGQEFSANVNHLEIVGAAGVALIGALDYWMEEKFITPARP